MDRREFMSKTAAAMALPIAGTSVASANPPTMDSMFREARFPAGSQWEIIFYPGSPEGLFEEIQTGKGRAIVGKRGFYAIKNQTPEARARGWVSECRAVNSDRFSGYVIDFDKVDLAEPGPIAISFSGAETSRLRHP